MVFSKQQLDELKDVLTHEVPIGLLLDLRDSYVPLPIEEWRKQYIGSADGGRAELAALVVDSYAKVQAVPRLAINLYRKLYRDPLLAPRLLFYTRDPASLNKQQQAALSSRARSMSFKASRLFWDEAAPRVCVVMTDKFGDVELGTGFLVAPNLIVTAYHTVEHLIDEGTALPTSAMLEKFAIFDFYEGAKVAGFDPRNFGRWVRFADDWLVDCSPGVDWDGTVDQPDPAQTAILGSHLDFALIRLAEPIGHEVSTENGGRRRGWFKFDTAAPALLAGQRISIPQHPGGSPQLIDFGFYVEQCPSGTRIRSDIETDGGTSGAPCFMISGEKFPLVGMHNAAFAPPPGGAATNLPAAAVLNQAIRFDHIAKRIDKWTKDAEKPPSRFWSTSPSRAAPEPIVGRDKLMAWIDKAASPAPPSTTFAALGGGSKIGRSFSVDILRAMRRESADRIIEVGTRGIAIPGLLPDLVQTLFGQLAIPQDRLQGMPVRPSADVTDAPDKLHRWTSIEVPRWFLGELADNRRRDPAAEPEAAAEPERNWRVKPLDATDPLPAARWDRLWIAIRLTSDDLLRTEIMDFVAGLAREQSENADFAEAVPLRWLFLGNLPDFASGLADEFRETLDPMQVALDDCLATVQAIADSLGKELSEDHLEGFEATFVALLQFLGKPGERLPKLQQFLIPLVPAIADAVR